MEKDLKSLIETKYGSVYRFIQETTFKKSTIYKILNSEVCNPTAKHVQRFADTLDISLEEVFDAIKVTNSNRHRDDGVKSEEG